MLFPLPALLQTAYILQISLLPRRRAPPPPWLLLVLSCARGWIIASMYGGIDVRQRQCTARARAGGLGAWKAGAEPEGEKTQRSPGVGWMDGKEGTSMRLWAGRT